VPSDATQSASNSQTNESAADEQKEATKQWKPIYDYFIYTWFSNI
jgi:hypothetical protein